MSKIIFQGGLLSFCISIIIFGDQQYGLMETISRSFIVFVCTLITCAVLVTIAAIFVDRSMNKDRETTSAPQSSREP